MKPHILRSLSLAVLALGLAWNLTLPASLLSQYGTSLPAQTGPGPGGGVTPSHVGSAGGTMMASSILPNNVQQIAIYDQPKQTMAVYHIDPSSGEIQLKSVRKLDADFGLQEFNLNEPTPTTIRKNVR
jgi:hypothetical protein